MKRASDDRWRVRIGEHQFSRKGRQLLCDGWAVEGSEVRYLGLPSIAQSWLRVTFWNTDHWGMKVCIGVADFPDEVVLVVCEVER